MQSLKFVFLFILSGFLFLACDDDNNSPCLKGEGNVVTETRSVSTFHSILSEIPADYFITQEGQQKLEISAQDNVLGELQTEVKTGVLELTFDRCVNDIDPIDITISMADIESIAIVGAGNVVSENDFNVDELSVSIAGAGNYTLKGTATIFDINIAGAGNIMAFDLVTNVCNVTIAGAGNVEVFVNNTLNVNISGNGTVYFKGNPTVTTTISGTGNVVDAN